MTRTILIIALSFLMLGAMCHRHSDFEGNTGVLKGVVIENATQEPLVGASIVLKGTTLGALTDINGKFKISQVPPGIDTFVVSYVGFVKTTTVHEVRPRETSECKASMVLEPVSDSRARIVRSGPHRTWGILRGVVTDSATRLPIAGAKIKVDFRDCEVYTDSSGRFRLDCAWVGNYPMKISRKSYHTRKFRDVEIGNDPTEVEFTLVRKK